MSIKHRVVLLSTIGFFLSPFQLWAGELMLSPDQMDSKSVQFSLYGSHAETKPIISLSSEGSIQIPVNGGTSEIFSGSNSDVEMEAESDAIIAAMVMKPREGLSYRFKVGQIRSFDLSYSSGSFVNELSSKQDGWLWGAGLRWNLTQGTLVSSAMNFDLSYTQTIVKLDRFESNSIVSAVDEKFYQDEFQGAFTISHRWKMVEPYAGLKIFRVVSHLRDNASKQEVKGHVDGVSPMLGLKFEIFDQEYLVVEGSFVDEKAVSAGMSVRF